MTFKTEVLEESGKALFIFEETPSFLKKLMKKILTFHISVFHADHVPDRFKDYTYIFIDVALVTRNILERLSETDAKIIILSRDKKIYIALKKKLYLHTYKNIKMINIDSEDNDDETVESIMWFMISDSHEKHLDLEKEIKPKIPHKIKVKANNRHFTRKKTIIIGLLIFLLVEFFFILPLAGSTFYIYRAGIDLKHQNLESASANAEKAEPYVYVAKKSYVVSRPLFLLFFLSLLPDNIISLEENAIVFIKTAAETSGNVQRFSALLLQQDKSPEEIIEAEQRSNDLKKQMKKMSDSSEVIKDQLDFNVESIKKVRDTIDTIHTHLTTSERFIKHIDTIFSQDSQKKYIVFFYNNMELRPGGGFIGSFATLTFENYTLKEFLVYDVYDADGQLKTHVEPPAPIRTYLKQPHWFLRDSNFSPDFEQNVKAAEYFLEKEMGMKDFDGAFAITTTGMSYIIGAFDSVYIPDFKDTLNEENFYLKVQENAEKDFFPGSAQKKGYLSTVARTLMLKLEDASPARLGLSIKKALDEKHIVMQMRDPEIQDEIDRLRWNGKLTVPQCITPSENCIVNHIFTVDANLGVNKVNFLIKKYLHLKTTINNDKSIDNVLTISFTNKATTEKFPGGTYKNYAQLYIPSDAEVTHVSIDGEKLPDYDESHSSSFKILGFYVVVDPTSTSIVTVNYSLKDKAVEGSNTYQIVVQKQIGAPNIEFSLHADFPEDVVIINQNFISLAKNNSVIYNSTLSTDRIFVISYK